MPTLVTIPEDLAYEVLPPPTGADDTLMIQTVINNMAPTNKRRLIAGAGVYLCNDIKPIDGLWVSGQGWDTVFQRPAGTVVKDSGIFNAPYLGPRYLNLRFSDFQIDGNKANAPYGRGISIENVLRCEVSNLWVHGCFQGGINIGGLNNPAGTVGRIFIHHNLAELCGMDNGWGQISVTGGNHIVIADNDTFGDPAHSQFGIDVETNDGWLAGDVFVQNNRVKTGSIFVIGTGSGVLTNVKITSNSVDARNAWGSPQAVRVALAVTGDVDILDNTIRTSPNATGIFAWTSAVDLIIKGNQIRGVGDQQMTNPEWVGIFHGNAGVVTTNHIAALSLATHNKPVGIVGLKPATSAASKYQGNTFINIAIERGSL